MNQAVPVNKSSTVPRFQLWHIFMMFLGAGIVLAVGRTGEPGAMLIALAIAGVEITFAMWWYGRGWGILLSMAWLGLGIALLMPGLSCESSPFGESRSNMRNITLALCSYHRDHGCYPPAYVTDSTGKPLYSWRVLILPYLERRDLYDAFHLDEPWDSPHNLSLGGPCPFPYYTFSQRNCGVRYVAIVGPQSMWQRDRPCAVADITDEPASTIMLVEWPESDIIWSEPRDLPADTLPLFTKPTKQTLANRPKYARDGSVVLGMADASVRVAKMPKLSPRTVQAMITRSGGEKIKPKDWDR